MNPGIALNAISCLAFLAILAYGAPEARAGGDFQIRGGGGDFRVRTRSFSDMRFKEVVRQQYDYSCGSAALATLLTYHYNLPIGEMDILHAMFANGDQDKIRSQGFSLLDMKNYLHSIGLKAEGYKESLDKLASVGVPAIVLLNKRGYMHFVVVKAVSEEKVSIGDPTLGLRIYDRQEFETMWNGILFVVLSNPKEARSTFNKAGSWQLANHPQMRNLIDRGGLGTMTLDAVRTPNYY